MRMELKILNKVENKLFNRIEVHAIAEHVGEATPKREEVRSRVAALLGVSEDLVVVRKIISAYRFPKSRILVHVYNDKESLMRLEPRYILKRNKIVE